MAENAEYEKLKALLESSSETDDKDAMLQNILNYIKDAKDDSGLDEEQLVQKLLDDLKSIYKPQATYYEYLLFVGVVSLIVSIFAFFGYKLYRSLTERQRKREEKLRAKSSKKKK